MLFTLQVEKSRPGKDKDQAIFGSSAQAIAGKNGECRNNARIKKGQPRKSYHSSSW